MNATTKPGVPMDAHRAAVKAMGFGITPWRLGVQVGKTGDDLPNPYNHAHSRQSYAAGVRYGQDFAKQARIEARKAAARGEA